MIQKMHSIFECVKQCVQGTQERFKFYADHKMFLREFKVGPKVDLKVTPKCSRLELE